MKKVIFILLFCPLLFSLSTGKMQEEAQDTVVVTVTDSAMAKAVEKTDQPSIRDAFLMWRFAGNKPILLNRRKREADLYFS